MRIFCGHRRLSFIPRMLRYRVCMKKKILSDMYMHNRDTGHFNLFRLRVGPTSRITQQSVVKQDRTKRGLKLETVEVDRSNKKLPVQTKVATRFVRTRFERGYVMA